MATETDPVDPMIAETQRVYDEYTAARTGWEADKTDPAARMRWLRAMSAVNEIRDHWRLAGAFTGDRDENGGGIRVADGERETDVPTLISQEG